jgi:hypothetical protein
MPFQSEGLVLLNQEQIEQVQEIYRLGAFASTNPALSGIGVVFVKFDLRQGGKGYIAVDPGDSPGILFSNYLLTSRGGKVLVFFDHIWKFGNGLFRAVITQTGKGQTFLIGFSFQDIYIYSCL